jgi:hypothetical protein
MMKKLFLFITAFLFLLIGLSSTEAQAQCGPLNSTMSNNNAQDGNMFHIVATNPIRIDSFWCNFYSGTVEEVEIWYREGGFFGFQNAATGGP